MKSISSLRICKKTDFLIISKERNSNKSISKVFLNFLILKPLNKSMAKTNSKNYFRKLFSIETIIKLF